MKILITGISGFVARHFVDYLSTTGDLYDVAGIYFRTKPAFDENAHRNVICNFHQMNLTDETKLKNLLLEFQPDYILHLASKSSVAYSWLHPAESITESNGIFLNIVEQLRILKLKCRLLSIGSSEEYGNVNEDTLPLKENQLTAPVNPYGASRLFQHIVGNIYSLNYDVDIIHTRSFNHLGPHQTESFVISSFAKQIAIQLINGKRSITLSVGNINVVRDFTDVRDVVKAYYGLLLNGKKGNTYNVCSNKGFILKDIISILAEITGTQITWEINKKNYRPSENTKIIGSYAKIKNEIGWEPEIPIKQSLSDLLEYWKIKVSSLQTS